MKETPLLFKAEMVRALLDGRKTQTRRLVKFDAAAPQSLPVLMDNEDPIYWAWDSDHYQCPYGQVGDRIWVKETWKPCFGDGSGTSFRADPSWDGPDRRGPWKPSIFLTKARSRITLEITAVRVERLNEISEADAKAEGCTVDQDPYWKPTPQDPDSGGYPSYRNSYQFLWESINGPESWYDNPWVWVLSFRRVKP